MSCHTCMVIQSNLNNLEDMSFRAHENMQEVLERAKERIAYIHIYIRWIIYMIHPLPLIYFQSFLHIKVLATFNDFKNFPKRNDCSNKLADLCLKNGQMDIL